MLCVVTNQKIHSDNSIMKFVIKSCNDWNVLLDARFECFSFESSLVIH